MKAKNNTATRYSGAMRRLAALTGPVSIDRGEYNKMMEEMLKNKQLVSVLLFDALFEKVLEDILLQTFSRRDKEVQTLVKKYNIPQKARLVYALGLINETTLKDIKQIRDIRNKFVHGMPKSFANAGVCKECRKLSIAKGQKVTINNSYDIYSKAVRKLIERLLKALEKA